MEAGKVGMNELVKVIEYIQTLKDDELIAKMLDTPEKKFSKLRTEWIRFLISLNEAGVLDAMIAAFEAITDSVILIHGFLKDNKEILRDIWSILKPMLGIWLAMWGAGKLMAFNKGINSVLKNFGVLSLVAGSGGSRIGKLISKVGLLRASLLLLNRAWNMFGKKSVLAISLLALVDIIETLQGKRTVLTQLMSEGGILGTGAKVLVGVFRTLQMVIEAAIALVTGDSGFFKDAIDRWSKAMYDIWPIDFWKKDLYQFITDIGSEFLQLGKLMAAVFSKNPVALYGAIKDYSAFKEGIAQRDFIASRPDLTSFDFGRSMSAPKLLRRPEPAMRDSLGAGVGSIGTINIEVNGTNVTDPQKLATMIKQEFSLTLLKESSNLVKRQ
jgi:hypothetical protein